MEGTKVNISNTHRNRYSIASAHNPRPGEQTPQRIRGKRERRTDWPSGAHACRTCALSCRGYVEDSLSSIAGVGGRSLLCGVTAAQPPSLNIKVTDSVNIYILPSISLVPFMLSPAFGAKKSGIGGFRTIISIYLDSRD